MAFFEKIKQTFKKNKDKDTYLSGLSKSRKTFGEKIRTLSNNFRGINEELLEEIMVILLESDMGYATAQKVVDEFEARSKELKDFDSMEDYLINILYDFYNPSKDEPIHFNEEGPTIILMVGVNGSGKTTTSAKLISYFREQGKNPAVAAADTFRAGAVSQIEEWAKRLDAPCIAGKEKQDPASVVVDACRYVKENGNEILICDTAGRLQNKTNLMRELEKIGRVAGREIDGAPHETWLVLDGTTGQNGISQAKEFMEVTPVSGIILTKMDGTARGGVVMAIREQLDLPVRFIGLGEKPEDLKEFDINSYLMGIIKGFDE